jgi:hypothetical protein
MRKLIEKLGSSRSPMEEREEHSFVSARTERLEEGERRWREGERYKYPSTPNGHLSNDSASL